MDNTKKKPVNPQIEQFYKSLSPSELEAHKIASRPGSEGGLGSSYIVEKTPAFLKWLKKQEEAQKTQI
jgi:hypothetical protein